MMWEVLRRVRPGAVGAQGRCSQLCLGVREGFLGEGMFEQALKDE